MKLKDGKKVSGFGFHDVVKVRDRYFDSLTGPGGKTWDEYMKLWENPISQNPKIVHTNLKPSSNIPRPQ